MRAYDNQLLAEYALADNITPVAGINDSTYDAFPASTSYMQGGFAQPVVSVAAPVVSAPAPTPAPPSQRCMRVIFSANQGFSATAYWTDCSGNTQRRFVSVGDTLEVDALEGTASGLPTTTYPIGGGYLPPVYTPPVDETPIYDLPPAPPVYEEPSLPKLIPPKYEIPEQPITYDPILNPYPPTYQEPTPVPLPPAPPIYTPVAPEPIPLPPAPPVYEQPTPVAPEPIEIPLPPAPPVLSGPAPTPLPPAPPVLSEQPETPAYKTDVIATPEVTPTVQTATPTPEVSTKTSKDLKPYIYVGIAIVGILIASRLMSKKS